MIASLRSELRKIATVRSTYVILAAALALVALFAGFIDGYRATTDSLMSPDMLSGEVTSAVGFTGVLTAIVGLLSFAHEYRYNTIMYTLTSNRSRLVALIAKILAVTIFIVPATLILGALSPLLALAGLHLHHLHIVHQSLDYPNLIWRSLLFTWGYAMFALVFVALIRNQVGAIVAFFIIPGTVENLLGLLLKDNQKYLPFTALGSLISDKSIGGSTPAHSAVVVACYMVAFWIIAGASFIRRDAN